MPGGREPMISDRQILNVLAEADDPWLTTSEIADKLDYSNQGIKQRLKELAEDGDLCSKRAGISWVWWLPIYSQVSLNFSLEDFQDEE
jgi:predicted ArsR family transcriptional regulator